MQQVVSRLSSRGAPGTGPNAPKRLTVERHILTSRRGRPEPLPPGANAALAPSAAVRSIPTSVTVGFRLLLTSSLAWLILIVLRLSVLKDWSSQIAALTASAARRGVPSSTVIALGITEVVVIGLMGTCLYVALPVVCAFQAKRGRRWARVAAGVPTAVMVLPMPGGNFFDYLATALMVAGMVFLFLPASRAFFRPSNPSGAV